MLVLKVVMLITSIWIVMNLANDVEKLASNKYWKGAYEFVRDLTLGLWGGICIGVTIALWSI